jgi:hypothetical protein
MAGISQVIRFPQGRLRMRHFDLDQNGADTFVLSLS